jgi:hypothetical protein
VFKRTRNNRNTINDSETFSAEAFEPTADGSSIRRRGKETLTGVMNQAAKQNEVNELLRLARTSQEYEKEAGTLQVLLSES